MAQDAVRYKIVVIGGSAGSLDVIMKILPFLPQASGVTYIIVVHRKNDPDSILTQLIAARTKMMVKEVEDKEPLLPDAIYIAPPDYHLLVENESLFSLDSSEKIFFSRPSIDVTFESVAQIFGTRVIGILLSGANADGAQGLKRVREAGGYTIAQDPASADIGFMPAEAINLGAACIVLPPDAIGDYVKNLVENDRPDK